MKKDWHELYDFYWEKPEVEHIKTLADDIENCTAQLKRSKYSQFWRRTFLRTVFAWIEADLNSSKHECYNFHERLLRPTCAISGTISRKANFDLNRRLLNDAELLMLMDSSAKLTDSGRAIRSDSFGTTLTNLKFVVRVVRRLYSAAFDIDFGNKEGEAFKKLIEARNRVTHPRSKFDIEISRDELSVCLNGLRWYAKASSEINDAILKCRADLRSHFDEWLQSLSEDQQKQANQLLESHFEMANARARAHLES